MHKCRTCRTHCQMGRRHARAQASCRIFCHVRAAGVPRRSCISSASPASSPNGAFSSSALRCGRKLSGSEARGQGIGERIGPHEIFEPRRGTSRSNGNRSLRSLSPTSMPQYAKREANDICHAFRIRNAHIVAGCIKQLPHGTDAANRELRELFGGEADFHRSAASRSARGHAEGACRYPTRAARQPGDLARPASAGFVLELRDRKYRAADRRRPRVRESSWGTHARRRRPRASR